jgi:hypothetical protein
MKVSGSVITPRGLARLVWGPASIAFLLLALAGCASTGFRSTWTEPSASSITLAGRKVAVFAIGIYEPMRRTAEDALAVALTARGAEGIAGYTVLSALEARNPAAARQKLQNAGVEGTVALRIVARIEHITSFPPTFWGHWDVDWPSPSDPNYIRTDTVVWVEARAYSVVRDKLLWVGESVAMNHTTVGAFIRELGAKTADAVQSAGLLRNSSARESPLRVGDYRDDDIDAHPDQFGR